MFLVLFLILQIPYFLPQLNSRQIQTYDWFLSVVFFLPLVSVLLWPAHGQTMPDNEKLFWKVLSLAFAFIWGASLINLLWLTGVWTKPFDVATESLFLGFYIYWFVALSFAPHDQHYRFFENSDRWLRGAGTIALSLFLFFYFILVPHRYSQEQFNSWIPALLFFSFMDIVLTLLLLRLFWQADTQRWRVLYGLMAINMFAFALLDLLEAMDYSARFHWADTAASNILWSMPFLVTVVIARARGVKIPQSAVIPRKKKAEHEHFVPTLSPILLMAFILPVLHNGLEQFGLMNELLERPLATVVLLSMGAFWILAVLENRTLRLLGLTAKANATENERLRVQQKVSEASERAKARFLANVSHEIRTPMNGILGISEIILRGKLDDEQQEQINLVHSSAQGLLGVIDDILVHAKIEASEFTFLREPFNLKELAGQVLDLFRLDQEKDQIGLYLESQDAMPLDLIGDPSRLRQVLVNLVGNALKFTHEGEVRLRFSLCSEPGPEVRIRCEVIDTGIGIKPETADQLFLPFSQADESTSRKYGGSGLGLTIAKDIVEAQSGRISVSSTPGKGSTFWFEMPFAVGTTRADGPDQEPAANLIPLPDGRILLAEDNEINQIVAARQLETLGKTADIAGDGNEVLEALKKHHYALILMDCQMPELDGLQATRRIREAGYSKADLPIIALTAHVLEEDREQCIDAGMNDFLSKPLSLEQLRNTLVNWL